MKDSIFSLLSLGAKAKSNTNRVVVLCYHSIHPAKSFASATPEAFDAQLQWLGEHCQVIPFSQALERAQIPSEGKPLVSLTFDEGYADNHQFALPLLSRRRFPATFFLTTGLIEGEEDVIERLAALQGAPRDEVGGLSWTQVLELRDAGMEVASHGRSHISLSHCDERTAVTELVSSKSTLEDHLGQPVVSFAYPFGKPKHHFSKITMRLVVESGYQRAAAVHMRAVRSDDSEFAIPRLPITGNRIDRFAATVVGRLDLVGHWQEFAPHWISRYTSKQNRLTG